MHQRIQQDRQFGAVVFSEARSLFGEILRKVEAGGIPSKNLTEVLLGATRVMESSGNIARLLVKSARESARRHGRGANSRSREVAHA